MSTVTKKHTGPMVPPPAKEPHEDGQLRRDRRIVAILVAVMAALMALTIWLASLSGGTLPDGIDHWPMIP